MATRVLHLTGDAEDIGGILSVLRNLQPEFTALGVEQAVWVGSDYEERRRPQLSYRYSHHVRGFSTNYWKLVYSTPFAFRELQQLLEKENFDIIHAHTQGTLLIALMLAQLSRRPVFFTNHSYANQKFLYRWIAKYTRLRVILLTPNMAAHFGLMPHGEPIVPVVSECADASFFASRFDRGRTKQQRKPIRLVGVGAIMRWKKWDVLLEAFKQLKPAEVGGVQFRLWGGTSKLGDSEEFCRKLEARIDAAGLRAQFKFCGMTDQVKEEVVSSDWFVLPSTNEPCSVALIEALALGVPAIVSRSGGNVDIIKEGENGLFFEPDNPASLAEVLRNVASGGRVTSTPEMIRDSVRLRTSAAVARKYHKLYKAAQTKIERASR